MNEQQLINQMIDLSEKKLEQLTALEQLSRRQSVAFANRDVDEIEILLDKKDGIIDHIKKLDDAFLSASGKLKGLLGIESLEAISGTDLDGKDRLKGLIAEIASMVESIIRIEQDSIDSAAKIKNEVGDKIKEINAGKRATAAYGIKPSGPPSYFFDKKK